MNRFGSLRGTLWHLGFPASYAVIGAQPSERHLDLLAHVSHSSPSKRFHSSREKEREA